MRKAVKLEKDWKSIWKFVFFTWHLLMNAKFFIVSGLAIQFLFTETLFLFRVIALFSVDLYVRCEDLMSLCSRLISREICSKNVKPSNSFRPMEQFKALCHWKSRVAKFLIITTEITYIKDCENFLSNLENNRNNRETKTINAIIYTAISVAGSIKKLNVRFRSGEKTVILGKKSRNCWQFFKNLHYIYKNFWNIIETILAKCPFSLLIFIFLYTIRGDVIFYINI